MVPCILLEESSLASLPLATPISHPNSSLLQVIPHLQWHRGFELLSLFSTLLETSSFFCRRKYSIAAAAKSPQSRPTLCNPIDGSPPGSPILGILQARTLVAIAFSNAWKGKVKVKSLSRVRLLATPWTAAYQAPPSMGFSRQEYCSGVPLPSPGLKLHIQKTKIMASGPNTSWQTDRETVEIVTDFIFLGSKITADADCGHEIKRCLLLGRKAMTNLAY